MKILNLMLSRTRGGLERALLDAHQGLLSAGCEVTSVFPSEAWIKSHWPPAFDSVPLRSFGGWDPFAVVKLARIADAQKPDLILCHGNRAVRTARLARSRRPVIAVCHTTNYSILKYLGSIDGAIALTSAYREVLVGAGFSGERTKLVPNAIRLGPMPDPPFSGDTVTIGGLGRFNPDKGFDVLIEACAILAKGRPDLRCVIGGVDDEGQVQSLEGERQKAALTSMQLQLPGWIDDAASFLRSIDIFCMPSRREVLSIALLEAMEAGRPLVCTRIPGFDTIFEDGKEGIFVAIDDATELAAAIAAILDDPAKGKRMGAAARERAKAFDVPVVGARLRDALSDIIEVYKRDLAVRSS